MIDKGCLVGGIQISNPLIRAGAEVVFASIGESTTVACMRYPKFSCDVLLKDVADQDFDCIVCPGGMPGAKHMGECTLLVDMLKKQKASDKHIAAICAAPAKVFAPHNLLGSRATCFPAFADALGATRDNDATVVIDGKVITSVGPGTALEFGLVLVGVLFGDEKMQEIGDYMQFQGKLTLDK